MAKLSFKLDEKALRARIAKKIGTKARTIVTALHKGILDRTPFNTGRTIGSWVASATTPVFYDIATSGGDYSYSGGLARTNHLPVGGEKSRDIFEKKSLLTVEKINFEQNPYRVFFIANGASLDSGNDFMPDASSLDQGPGSRAFYQEYGVIASYDAFNGKKDFFTPRGTNAVQLAADKIRLTYGKH